MVCRVRRALALEKLLLLLDEAISHKLLLTKLCHESITLRRLLRLFDKDGDLGLPWLNLAVVLLVVRATCCIDKTSKVTMPYHHIVAARRQHVLVGDTLVAED